MNKTWVRAEDVKGRLETGTDYIPIEENSDIATGRFLNRSGDDGGCLDGSDDNG
jgi:hypothetical protein